MNNHRHKLRIIRHLKKMPKWLLILIVTLVAIRLMIPFVGKWVINKQLASKLGNYEGHIDQFDLSILGGAYELKGLVIRQKSGDNEPLIEVSQFDIAIVWRSLVNKMVTSNIKIFQPVIHLVDNKDPKKKQFGLEGQGNTPEIPDKTKTEFGMAPVIEQWKNVSNVLMPMKIENLSIENGAIYFTNTSLQKPIPVGLEKIAFHVKNLRTRQSQEISPFSFHAFLQENAELSANGEMDILANPFRASVDFQLVDFHVPTVNQILLAYVPIDITHGDLSIYGEMATAGDAVGYMKVFFKKGNIVIRNKDFLSIKHVFAEITTGAVNWFLKNKKTENVAFEAPFAIRGGKLDIDGWETFWSAIKNSVDSLQPGIDHKISLADVDKKKDLVKKSESDRKTDKTIDPKEDRKKKSKK